MLSSGKEAGTRRDWMNISQCAPDLSCLTAPCDEAQVLNALAGFMCVWMSYAATLSHSSCAVFISCLFLSMNVLSYSTTCVFYADWWTVYGQYDPGGWILQAETTHSTIYTQSVLRLASLSFKIFSFFYGVWHFSFFFFSSVCGETGNIYDVEE